MIQRLSAAGLAALLGLAFLSGVTARAQETSGLPVQPEASECTVTPLTLDELYAIVGTPVAGTPMAETDDETATGPEVTPAAGFTLPVGEPADQATIDAITATVRMALACFNAGNYLAFLAMGTDNWLEADLEDTPLTEEDVAFFSATPQTADPAAWSTLVAVREVTQLPDGRVGAFVDTIFPDEGPDIQTEFISFAEEDGQWKFDDIVEDLEGQYPPEAEATPTS